jgi:ssDNA-specific exonuclease RecJ
MPTYIPEREHFRGYKMVDSKSEVTVRTDLTNLYDRHKTALEYLTN